ncbi:PilN domain-containing protein [Actimicrobium sp. CCI2.3]|uniref:PilN domain-containing protein n=1 Tax=Actimicrobium sp. CCI2.3 TaxID=3048616 RepID=UPI002AB598C7|nr:PilN domain-containing protein [Actimicrobium sp. CCI2.3]MDY7572938.1 PilN domain-containing protein [Actimicrobium sp. CCI2.3]MEB0020783.1 PilN domain-containing protein [Actimicrobium sp. CCI2.3]
MSQQINLFNPAYSRSRKNLSAVLMLQVLGAIVVVALLVTALLPMLFFSLEKQAREATSAREVVEARLLKLRKDDTAGVRDRLLDDRIRTVSSEIRSMQQIIDALGKDLSSDTNGYSSTLQAFARHGVDGLWLTGLSVAGNGHDMRLQGRALQPELVAVYLANLKRAPILKGVTFSTLDIASGTGIGYVEFDLRSTGMPENSAIALPPGLVPFPTSLTPSGAKP